MAFPAVASADNTISSSSIEKAINYAYDEKSTRPDYWKGYCAAFVWACYNKGAGISNRSYPTAREMGDALITHTDSNPPRGALVFWYKTANPYGHAGHVGLSLGDGTVIHAYSSIKVTSISTVNNGGYTYRGWGAPISGYTLETETPPSELTLTGAVYPSGHYDSLPNFGLRGIFSSPGTITEINAKIATQSGNVHMSYNKKWNSSIYNIQSDGLNNQFTFRDLPDGFYQYYVEAKDNYGKTASVSSWFSIGSVTYTINYDANGGIGAPSNQTKIHDTVLTLSSTRPTRSNSNAGSFAVTLNANGGSVNTSSLSAARTTSYTFKNWNTAADGSETSYNVGASYSENAAATLYAQWNSSTSTAAVTLPTPTRTGYTFKGWSTSSTATSGVTDSYTPTGNVTLYAVWDINKLTMKYNTNGGAINSDIYTANTSSVIQKSGSEVTTVWNFGSGDGTYGLYNASTFALSRNGYSFVGWSLSRDGSSTVFDQDDMILKAETIYPNLKNGSATITLYAIWESNALTMQYNANGGTVGINDKNFARDNDGFILRGENRTVSTWRYGSNYEDGLINDTSFALFRLGYTFRGWRIGADENAAVIDQNIPLTPETICPELKNGNQTITLYAVWEPNVLSLQYNVNGGNVGENEYNFTQNTDGNILRSGNKIVSIWKYDNTYVGGLINDATFGLTRPGYTFQGWRIGNNDSSAVYDQNVDMTAEMLCSDIKYGNQTITLYAVWQKNAPDFILPAALKEIDEEAFADCAFGYVHIPDGVTRIERRAFADCPNLHDVDIPESATSIDPTAFAGTSGLTIHSADGSYAEFYAGKYGFAFIPVA